MAKKAKKYAPKGARPKVKKPRKLLVQGASPPASADNVKDLRDPKRRKKWEARKKQRRRAKQEGRKGGVTNAGALGT